MKNEVLEVINVRTRRFSEVSCVVASFEVVKYNEKALVIFGDEINTVKKFLQQHGGSFNHRLKYENDVAPGCVFPLYKKDKVIKLMASSKMANLFYTA